ncbi:MAG: class I SAM-dependent methyltransferase [Bacteroidota bacterium]
MSKEYISACVLCAGSTLDEAAHKDSYSIVRCRDCGLIFVNPRASEREVLEQYTSDSTSPSEYYVRTATTDHTVFQKRLALVERYFPKSKLLDVGCSVGTFLTTASERGWDVEGIEANVNSVQYCQSKGLQVQHGFFEEETFNTGRNLFDVIHFGDVIEHFRNPVDAVRLAGSLLRVGGGAVIVTPNFDSVVARTFQTKPLEHLFYFTDSTMRRMLEGNGFKVLLILKTTRRRDIDSMRYGTTFTSRVMKWTLKFLATTRLSVILSWLLEKVVKDELLVVAQKVS